MAAMLKTKQEAENKVKEFLKNTVSDISHQLKTPLAALSMYQEIMMQEADQPIRSSPLRRNQKRHWREWRG